MMKKHGNLFTNLRRSVLPVVLAGAVVALQPVTVLADTPLDSVAVDGVTEPVAGATPSTAGVDGDKTNYHISGFSWLNSDQSTPVSGNFEAGHSYYATFEVNGFGGYVVNSSTTATVNGNTADYGSTRSEDIGGGSFIYYNRYFMLYTLSGGGGSCDSGTTPAPAPVVLSPHDQNEQAALRQQAMERELQAAGVMGLPTASSYVATMAPDGNFTAVKSLFRRATRADAGTWGVYSKAANGNKDAIWSLFTAAANGDQNAILALYAAASDGNPFAIFELQVLGLPVQ